MTHLAALLRQLRKQRRLTLQEASNAAELTLSYLCDIERSRAVPSLALLDRLLGAYDHRLTIVDERVTKILGPSPKLLDEVS